MLGEGQHFGEAVLLYDAPRMATVRARTALELDALGKEDFAALLAAEPDLCRTLERVMAERERSTAALAAAQAT